MGHDQIIDKLALCTVKDLDQVQLSERSLCALAITCNLDVEKPRCLEVCVGYPELLADVSKRRGLHEILIERGFCTDDQIIECLAIVYGVPYAKLEPRIADPRIVDCLPRDYIEKNLVFPLFKTSCAISR